MAKGVYTLLNGEDSSPLFVPSPLMTIATAAMQGLLSSGMTDNSPEFIAQRAVRYAKALLTELTPDHELEKHKPAPERANQ